jgi:hypothetical protein
VASLLEEFLSEEANDYVVATLREAANQTHGKRDFTFNRFNVRLDLEERTATIEDELDSEAELTIDLDDLLGRF